MTNPGKYQGKDKETHRMCASAKAKKEGTVVPHDVGREGGEVHGISVAEVTVKVCGGTGGRRGKYAAIDGDLPKTRIWRAPEEFNDDGDVGKMTNNDILETRRHKERERAYRAMDDVVVDDVVEAVGEAVGDVETLMQLVVVAVGDVEALMQLAVGDSGVAHHVDRVSHRPRTRS